MPPFLAAIVILGIVVCLITYFLVKSYLTPKKIAGLAQLVKGGKYAAASRQARALIAKEPRNCDAHYLLGLSYLGENKPELALMELKQVNDIGVFGPFTPESEFRKKIASLFARFDQPEEALKEYVLLAKAEPGDADNYYQAGVLFEQRENQESAGSYYRKAIEIDPRHSDAHYRLGTLLYRMQRPVEAKVELEAAIKVQPENYRAHYYLGRLLRDSREYVGALLAFEKAQRDPDLKVKALVERGAAFLSMNNVEKAVIDLERAVRLGGSDGSAEVLFGRYLLAAAYERTRVLDKAITQWEQIYQKKPGYRDVAAKLSQYQDLRTDDRMKDYLTANPADFQEICRAVVTSMGLAVRDVSDVQNGCQVIAVDDESKWRNARKLPTVIRFLRVPEVVQDTTARSVYEQARKMNVNRAIIVTSSGFSRKAAEFAETRPIDLLGKDRLQELLRKAEFSWSS